MASIQEFEDANLGQPTSAETALATTPFISGDPALLDTLNGMVAGELSVHTRRAYLTDSHQFAAWLTEHNLTLATVRYADMVEYRRHLYDKYAARSKATAARKLTVAKKLLTEAVNRGVIAENPAARLKGYRLDGGSSSSKSSSSDDGSNTTPHSDLEPEQAAQLLESIDQTTLLGQRDYNIINLLLRTGLRRSEAAALTLGDLGVEHGHHVATIQHGKGDKRRKVKIPPDVWADLETYLKATGAYGLEGIFPELPLFVQMRRGDKLDRASKPISDKLIERVVKERAEQAGLGDVRLTPHGLRATFVTLALEGGAKLHQVQYAVGHADPRTTEHYQKRKLNLADNASDYVHIPKKQSEAATLETPQAE